METVANPPLPINTRFHSGLMSCVCHRRCRPQEPANSVVRPVNLSPFHRRESIVSELTRSRFDFASTIRALLPCHRPRTNYHTYWLTDLAPFGMRQEYTLKSFFATQNPHSGSMAISPATRCSQVTSPAIRTHSSSALRTCTRPPGVRRSKTTRCYLAVMRRRGLMVISSASWCSRGMEVYGWIWTPSSLLTLLPCSCTSL